MGLFQSDVFSVKQLFGNQRPNKYFSNCFAKWFRRVFLNEFLKLLREVISTFQQYFRTITNRKRLNCLKYRYNLQRSYSKTFNKMQWKKYYERFYFSKVTGRRLRNVSGKFFSTKKNIRANMEPWQTVSECMVRQIHIKAPSTQISGKLVYS